eukprot:m.133689 g.133689  ORF g.133689 m.133689 type:complete len:510 (-) comp14678_c0_seq1:41-1570(-)
MFSIALEALLPQPPRQSDFQLPTQTVSLGLKSHNACVVRMREGQQKMLAVIEPENIERTLMAVTRKLMPEMIDGQSNVRGVALWRQITNQLAPRKWVDELTGKRYDLSTPVGLALLCKDARQRLPDGYITLSSQKSLDQRIKPRRSMSRISRDEKPFLRRYLDPPDHIPDEEQSDCLPWFPTSHFANRAMEVISMATIIASIVGIFLESFPRNRFNMDGSDKDTPTNLFTLDAVCVAIFTIEYAWRFLVAANKFKFFFNVMNIIDFLAILPFYLAFAIEGDGADALGVLRVLRLLKVSRYSTGMQDMALCMYASRSELTLFAMILAVSAVLFSSAVYFAEESVADTQFQSIPEGFWWVIVTITTVGYGDASPSTVGGKIVGAVCVSIGVIALSIPASLFISEFLKMHGEKAEAKTFQEVNLGDNPEEDLSKLLQLAKSDVQKYQRYMSERSQKILQQIRNTGPINIHSYKITNTAHEVDEITPTEQTTEPARQLRSGLILDTSVKETIV